MLDTTQTDSAPDSGGGVMPEKPETPEATKALVKRVIGEIRLDKTYFEKSFLRMERDMQVAMWGAQKKWGEEKYRANITGRHVKQRTSTLYAKNPKIKASKPDRLDFAVWDETPESLKMAFGAVQMAQEAVATGAVPGEVPPAAQQALAQAQAVIADFQQGMARRDQLDKIAKTLEILFSQAMIEQKPIDFKTAMKKLVRRAITTCVGYVELGFQRQTGQAPDTTEKLADHHGRIAHLRNLAQTVAGDDAQSGDIQAETAELQAGVSALMSQPEIVLREGLIFDYPRSTKVIPDRCCQSLVGFVGSNRVTIEYDYTVDQIKKVFGVDVTKDGMGYSTGTTSIDAASALKVQDSPNTEATAPKNKGDKPVLVWKSYDKAAGLVYIVADGYCDFLKPPAAPDVFVEDFWPVYALTFNDVENEKELYPPSDVALMLDMQEEHNRSREGLREHRHAARPRWVDGTGSMSTDDKDRLSGAEAFTVTTMGLPPGKSIEDVLNVVPVPGVDMNLYETGPIFSDTQLVVGAAEARFGGTSKATATESAIAEGSTSETDSSNIEDLDSFLTCVARASGQILLKEMTADIVMQKVGPGALWPDATLAEIAGLIFLEVEAGSTGKPNQAVEIANWTKMLPFLVQMPDLTPGFLAKETLRRLDDKMDFDKAIAVGAQSIIAQNMVAGAAATAGAGEGPGKDPGAQGPAGSNKSQDGTKNGPGGSGPSFGSNQTG